MPNSAKWHSSKTQVLCGFEPNSAISLSQALGQRLLCCPKRGTYVPPFWEYGKAGPTVLATPLGPWDAVPHPATFEKVDETFTCLHPTYAEGPALGSRKKAACPARPRTGVRDLRTQALGADVRWLSAQARP